MTDNKLRQFTKSLSDTLLGLRPLGGSECFMRVGEDYYADYRYFGRVIEEQRNSLDELRRSEVRQQREIALLQAARRKVRSYNSDILAERINYRPLDHILVIDDALTAGDRAILPKDGI